MFRKPVQHVTIESIRETVSRKTIASPKKEKPKAIEPVEEVPVQKASPLTFHKQEDKLPKVIKTVKVESEPIGTEKKLRGDHILWIQ